MNQGKGGKVERRVKKKSNDQLYLRRLGKGKNKDTMQKGQPQDKFKGSQATSWLGIGGEEPSLEDIVCS